MVCDKAQKLTVNLMYRRVICVAAISAKTRDAHGGDEIAAKISAVTASAPEPGPARAATLPWIDRH